MEGMTMEGMTLEEAIKNVNRCVQWEANGEYGFELLSIEELRIVLSAAERSNETCTMGVGVRCDNKPPFIPCQCAGCSRLYWTYGDKAKPNYCPHCGRRVVNG